MNERSTIEVLTDDGNLITEVEQDYRQEIALANRQTFIEATNWLFKVIEDGARRLDDKVALLEFHTRDGMV